nr:NACHT domain-containing protein [uncultured Actinoplanes sp.]
MSRRARARRARTRKIWLLAGFAGGAACVFVLGLALRLSDLQTAANLAQLLSIGIALAPLLLWLTDRWRAPRPPTVADREATRQNLTRSIAEQWRAEARVRALDDPDPIPVRWRLTDRDSLIDAPANRTAGVLTVASSADVATLVADFRALRRQRLVILGGAGAGKTTLAVQILLELLRGRAADDPVPVLLPLSGCHGDLREWMADRIIADHPDADPAVIDELVEAGAILPILDGLDETAADVREDFIASVHTAFDGSLPLILTSRVAEFEAAVASAGRALSSAVVIEPEPLTPPAAAEYLGRCLPADPGPTWREILSRLSRDDGPPGLAEVASTPLGLWLIRAALISPAADPASLLDDRPAGALRAHLFDQLIPATIAARQPSSDPTQPFRPRNTYDPVAVRRWLRFLAQDLDRRGVNELDWAGDTAELTTPLRWAAPIARLTRPPKPPHAVYLWLALIVVGVLCVVRNSSTGTTVVMVLLALGIAIARYLVLVNRYAERRGPGDRHAMIESAWRAARHAAAVAVPPIAYAAGFAAMTGVVTAVATRLILGGGAGPAGARMVAAATGLVALMQYLDDRAKAPGSYRQRPWYGHAPWKGLRGLFFLGAILAGLAVFCLVAFVDPGDFRPSDLLAVVFTVMAPVVAAGLILIVNVVMPALLTLTNLLLAPVFRAPGPGSDTASLWHADRTRQLRQFATAGLMTVMLAVVVCLACRRAEATSRVGDFDLVWSGHQRYVVAFLIGVLVTVPREGRSLLRLAVFLLVAVPVAAFWPGPDDFRLELLRTGSSLTLKTLGTSHTVDLAALVRDDGFGTAVFVWFGLLAFVLAVVVVGYVDGAHSRVWWSTWLMTRWHAHRGRLPKDPVVFLDDAHRLGLLRAVGPAYQFRHAEFQEHLTA